MATEQTRADVSLLQPLGYRIGDCGYCKSEASGQRTSESRASYYVGSKSLLPQHYQELMDRGWRRSGTLLYLPDLARSCCPHYTIRLPASEFQPGRDQRQALNRWNRFVLGEKYIKNRAIRYPKTKEQRKQANNVFDLYSAVHESEASNTKPDLQPDHKLDVTLEPDTFTEEKYRLFEAYQRNVHHEAADEISRSGFKGFLCGSPIKRTTDRAGKNLGSYHQCYRLDGQLIAMSVLDLLPHAISGVYFIYHQDFEQWSMGKLSALREAALAGESGYDFYYMGYYIHSCAKMKYKGTYKQQYVLDYETLGWNPLDDEMQMLMDQGGAVSISAMRRKEVEQKATDNTVHVDDTRQHATWILPNPSAAVESGRSLLDIRMPGILSLEELQTESILDEIRMLLGRGRVHFISNLEGVRVKGSELDSSSLTGLIAEYAACVGPTIAHEAIVDFSR